MTLRHPWLLAIALSAVSVLPAAAQGFPQQPQQQPPCMKDFAPLRAETDKRGQVLQEAGKRKAPPTELCSLITEFAKAEAKLVAFMEREGAWCGIPTQAVQQVKASHAKSQEVRKRVCAAAAAPQAAPRGPTFSDALGTGKLLDPNTMRSGRGTFDTLTGNALTR
jgi:hypothetical protein